MQSSTYHLPCRRPGMFTSFFFSIFQKNVVTPQKWLACWKCEVITDLIIMKNFRIKDCLEKNKNQILLKIKMVNLLSSNLNHPSKWVNLEGQATKIPPTCPCSNTHDLISTQMTKFGLLRKNNLSPSRWEEP